MDFVGRRSQLALLSRDLTDVAVSGEGRFIQMHGRRRVGKSRLVEEFLRAEQPASVFFTASRQAPGRELELFTEAIRESSLPAAELASGTEFSSWEAALGFIASTARRGEPSVVVIDEFPYLLEDDPTLEAVVQKVWDRQLAQAPVLLVLVGSDLAMMEALAEYGRPLFGRPTRILKIPPFSPAEVAELTGLDPVEAIDAYLIVGGLPLVARSWRPGEDQWSFLGTQLKDPTSPLIVDAERTLSAEFPSEAQARRVLTAIGAGETTFSKIGRTSGVQQTSLQRALELLVERKQVVTSASPLSAKAARGPRYWIRDPYLRFWLRFVGPHLEEIERGRSELVVERIRENWPTYRGKAVEPLAREALTRLLPDPRAGDGTVVGGYWTRTNDLEVDIVIADKAPRASRVTAVGSIKWRSNEAFDRRDRDEFVRQAAGVPGVVPAPKLIGVSRNGFSDTALDLELGPVELLGVWKDGGDVA